MIDVFVLGFGLGCVPILCIVIYAIVRGAIDDYRNPHPGPRGRGYTEEFFN